MNTPLLEPPRLYTAGEMTSYDEHTYFSHAALAMCRPCRPL